MKVMEALNWILLWVVLGGIVSIGGFGFLHVIGMFESDTTVIQHKHNVTTTTHTYPQSYSQAKLKELASYHQQYNNTNDEMAKAAVAATARFRFENYQMDDRVPVELVEFWNHITQNKQGAN